MPLEEDFLSILEEFSKSVNQRLTILNDPDKDPCICDLFYFFCVEYSELPDSDIIGVFLQGVLPHITEIRRGRRDFIVRQVSAILLNILDDKGMIDVFKSIFGNPEVISDADIDRYLQMISRLVIISMERIQDLRKQNPEAYSDVDVSTIIASMLSF